MWRKGLSGMACLACVELHPHLKRREHQGVGMRDGVPLDLQQLYQLTQLVHRRLHLIKQEFKQNENTNEEKKVEQNMQSIDFNGCRVCVCAPWR